MYNPKIYRYKLQEFAVDEDGLLKDDPRAENDYGRIRIVVAASVPHARWLLVGGKRNSGRNKVGFTWMPIETSVISLDVAVDDPKFVPPTWLFDSRHKDGKFKGRVKHCSRSSKHPRHVYRDEDGVAKACSGVRLDTDKRFMFAKGFVVDYDGVVYDLHGGKPHRVATLKSVEGKAFVIIGIDGVANTFYIDDLLAQYFGKDKPL